ncbi:hypothetical protein DPEC_G00194450 [Dallia pectoralis]|uniref:Uncharacterized protein n=1 Tax=Dallia pectoralis TaxID=75939 RepID=A0ACC2G710_DALPE|nr:hypothetical protein DPEC_G00194450 [Dallia pectoralis]
MAARHLILVTLLIYPPQPCRTVSPTVIREKYSVQLSCETPPSVVLSHYPHSNPASLRAGVELRKPDINIKDESSDDISIACVLPESVSDVSRCYLYTGDHTQPYRETQATRMMSSSSSSQVICIFSVSKTDLFRCLEVRRDVSCDYRENIDSHSVSPRSDGYNLTVLKPQISLSQNEEYFFMTCEIPGHAGSDTTCNLYVGDQKQRIVKSRIWKKKSKSNQWFCQFTVTEDDLIKHLQSVRRKEVKCDYRVSSGPNSVSPRSDGYNLTETGLTVSSTLTSDTPKSQTDGLTSSLTPSTAENPTSGGQTIAKGFKNSNRQESNLVKLIWLAAVGVGSGVGVFLVGLTAVSFCGKTKTNHSQRPQAQQDDHIQHTVLGDMSSGDLVESGNDGYYSVIATVPGMSSGSVPENGLSSEKENFDTYHIYSSIPDRPATSSQTEGAYSLLQTR